VASLLRVDGPLNPRTCLQDAYDDATTLAGLQATRRETGVRTSEREEEKIDEDDALVHLCGAKRRNVFITFFFLKSSKTDAEKRGKTLKNHEKKS